MKKPKKKRKPKPAKLTDADVEALFKNSLFLVKLCKYVGYCQDARGIHAPANKYPNSPHCR